MLPQSSSSFRRSPKSLFSAVIILLIASCAPHQQSGDAESYIDDQGHTWAYGSVQVAAIGGPAMIMVKRQSSDQSLDDQQGAGARFEMVGAMQAVTGDAASGRKDLAYVDYHPEKNRLLAYAYSLYADPRPYDSKSELVDIYAELRHSGRSYYGNHRVYLGQAFFQNGSDLAPLNRANGLHLSLIANGVYAGQWAMHYPNVEMVEATPWQGMCPRGVSQIPGQSTSQNPTQTATCKPLPAEIDLCDGDPTKPGCRPDYPAQNQQGDRPKARVTVEGLDTVEEDGETVPGSYVLSSGKEAKLVFVSETMTSTAAKNAATCTRVFNAVARTIDGQINSACVLKPAPAKIDGDKLTCGLTISFVNAETYMEKVCNVTAVFKGAASEIQTVQVLKP
jgi:hypothetical protein